MRRKLLKFKEIADNPLVIEPEKEIAKSIKSNWHTFFGNENPLVVELGCGKGDYTIGLARRFPETNFVGIDIKGDRIWTGSTIAREENLTNVAFLRIHILEMDKYIDASELSEIWITFPDPRPKIRDAKRRLTSERFMRIYQKLLKPGGIIHFKTDDEPLFDYTLDFLSKLPDVGQMEFTRDYHVSHFSEALPNIVTTYEKKFIREGLKIKYLRFSFLNKSEDGSKL